ncbi:CBP80/20-dependent translation initiation factor isoform X1 [Tachysurus ichikawai]
MSRNRRNGNCGLIGYGGFRSQSCDLIGWSGTVGGICGIGQRDFKRREELQQTDVESWLGFITFLCEVFSTMRSSTGEPYRVLVCPIYTCLREVHLHRIVTTYCTLLITPHTGHTCRGTSTALVSYVQINLSKHFL